MPTSTGLIISDDVIKPLVYVPDQCLGLLVHPGSTIAPLVLSSGWHYHWPFLSVIRVYHQGPVEYHIDQRVNSTSFGDEPVVAVTQDHQLITITGILILQLDASAPIGQLQHLNRGSLQRLIRPTIRQTFRQIMASYPAKALLTGKNLATPLEQSLNQHFSLYYISVKLSQPLVIKPYHNFLANRTQNK